MSEATGGSFIFPISAAKALTVSRGSVQGGLQVVRLHVLQAHGANVCRVISVESGDKSSQLLVWNGS
jgi:hypothetical protein